MNQTSIEHYDVETWPISIATRIQNAIHKTLLERGSCDVMLTGGRSAARLYKAWRNLPTFHTMTGVSFYFGDERCVPQDHLESNYGMAMRTLFNKGLPKGCAIVRMEADCPDRNEAAMAYEQKLPRTLDVLLLSVGEDGHIASLFPHGSALHEICQRVVPVWSPKPPNARLTITPPVLAQAGRIFVLAIGTEKAAVLQQARVAPKDIDDLPARLVLGATWLLDTPLQN